MSKITEQLSSTSQQLGMHRTLHKIQGGKYKLLPKIIETLNKTQFNGESTWVEPFFGTGVVGFNLAPENAFFYDINPNIINLYSGIKQRKITLRSFTKLLNEHKKLFENEGSAHYYRLRDSFNASPDPLTFLILNRVGYNGLVRFSKRNKTYNVPYGKNDLKLSSTLIDELMELFASIAYKIKHNNWHFKVASFQDSISKHINDDNSVLFCDPPYMGRDTQYFTSWGIEDEMMLHKLLSSHIGSFILTTWFGEYQMVMNEDSGKYENGGMPTEDMPAISTNNAFNQFWKDFDYDTLIHKYSIAGAKKRIGVYEAIVYK